MLSNHNCPKCEVCPFPSCGLDPNFHYRLVNHEERQVVASKGAYEIWQGIPLPLQRFGEKLTSSTRGDDQMPSTRKFACHTMVDVIIDLSLKKE